MGNLGVTEILLIGLVIMIFFGSKKIPEIAQGLGKGIREFKKAAREIDEPEEPSPKQPPATGPKS
jgi:sec-independent protein translocase protein TatA